MPLKQRDAQRDEQWERVHRSNYSFALRSAHGWFAAADELQFAADLIKPQAVAWWAGVVEWQAQKKSLQDFPPMGCHSILMMLHAYVIENLCKGALVRGGAVELSSHDAPNPGIPGMLKSHRLRQLARDVELTCSDKEQELLGRLTRAAVWRGRYPIAKSYKPDMHVVLLDDGTKKSATWFAQNDISRVEEFVTRLRDHVRAPRGFRGARDAAP